ALPALQSFDQCDIDIRPSGVAKNPHRNLLVEYSLVNGGLDLGLTVTSDTQTFDVIDSDGTALGGLTNAQRANVSLRWKDVVSDPNVTVALGARKPTTVKSNGNHDASEHDMSPCFEREGSSDELTRIRCRYRGRTTFIAVRVHAP